MVLIPINTGVESANTSARGGHSNRPVTAVKIFDLEFWALTA